MNRPGDDDFTTIAHIPDSDLAIVSGTSHFHAPLLYRSDEALPSTPAISSGHEWLVDRRCTGYVRNRLS
jgi:hypothetical protein